MDERAADARSQGQKHDVREATPGPEAHLPRRQRVDIVVGERGNAESPREFIGEALAGPAGENGGRIHHDALDRVDLPRRPDPDARNRPELVREFHAKVDGAGENRRTALFGVGRDALARQNLARLAVDHARRDLRPADVHSQKPHAGIIPAVS